MVPRTLAAAFLLPYGEPSDAFFADTVLSLLCADARRAGHEGTLLRVYYDGGDPVRDRQIAQHLAEWLEVRDIDVLVTERLFDPEPIARHLAARPGRHCLQVSRGDSIDPPPGVDLMLGAPNMHSGGRRRSPRVEEIRRGFSGLLAVLAGDGELRNVRGLSMVAGSGIEPCGALPEVPSAGSAPLPFDPVVDCEVLCLGDPPPVTTKTLLGNVGCPYAADPFATPFYEGLVPPEDGPLARLGCGFCPMGGDYERRPQNEVVSAQVAQALYYKAHAPDVRALVLSDQYALPYLAELVRAAAEAGVPPRRWLFAARADAFVRERAHVEHAIEAAHQSGHLVEAYLTGFESFSDAELRRYSKGCTAEDLLAAINAMRDLRRESPDAFDFATARGHSLILWSPWTTPADLRASVESIRAHGLTELFDELGRNRLRLYRDLPIYHAAERDGLLTDDWQDQGGAGARKGYSTERPWRFADDRTARAHDMARVLRERLGHETEVGQLRAVVHWVETADGDVETAAAHLGALDASLAGLLDDEGRPEELPRSRTVRAAPVLLAGACNNGCPSCPNRDRFLSDSVADIERRVEAARDTGKPVVLAGREPTLHPAFIQLVRAARGHDGRPVALVTNGRRFAYEGFTRSAVRAGLTSVSVKLFAPEAKTADDITRTPGAHAHALAGIRHMVAQGVAVEIRAPLHAASLEQLSDMAALTQELGATTLRPEVALDALTLAAIPRAIEAMDQLTTRCIALRLPLDPSPLSAGTRAFDRVPRPRA